MPALPEGWIVAIDDGFVVLLAPVGRFVELEIAPPPAKPAGELRADATLH
ncbi:MAG TPA: hypothetical protein VF814_11595 [Casimicrobiaceae bacterium]